MQRPRLEACRLLVLAAVLAGASAPRAAALSDADLREIKSAFQMTLWKKKGPFAENYCLCSDGAKEPVAGPDGKTPRAAPCGQRPVVFCAADRAEWVEPMTRRGLFVGNLFVRDARWWDSYGGRHHDLVRGYLLEDYFIAARPEHKYAQLRAYGGLTGAEYEAPGVRSFSEKYLALPDWSDFRHYLLSYELQRRFFVRMDIPQIQKVRALSLRLRGRYAAFKPICDAIHNRISAAQAAQVLAFRDTLPPASADRAVCDEIAAEIVKLTSLGQADLQPQIAELQDAAVRARLEVMLAQPAADAITSLATLGSLMATVRETIAARTVAPADARRLIDLNITAAAAVHSVGTDLLEMGGIRTMRDGLRVMRALGDATYGTGLLSARERQAAATALDALLATPEHERVDLYKGLQRTGRAVEWAQNTVRYSFQEVMPVWTAVMPEVQHISDDILRASPLLVFGQVARLLEDSAARELQLRHEIFGTGVSSGVRALNPGLALGRVRVAPAEGTYDRTEIVVLPETPPELQPVAGILTQGEGNLVSHVQLLARALGVPNVVLDPALLRSLHQYDGKEVLLLVTPFGRVFLKEAARMTPQDHAIVAEYTRNQKRAGDARLAGTGRSRLHIDKERLRLDDRAPVDLAAVGRHDSGVRSGPKAAFLGELKRLFPERVSRGVVLPFGVYHAHYRAARVSVPPSARGLPDVREGEPLPTFVERTYADFFGRMAGSGLSEAELSAWIGPRLDVIRASIEKAPLAPELVGALRAEMQRQGLFLDAAGTRTVGCFVRSDTNVEDQPEFNGAGLNLTLFNLGSFDGILEGIKKVWASPFTYRSFSWRQTLIDEPLWVLPSIVILESVPSQKSGVLITADVETGDPGKMLVGTAEGVGGVVDGSPAETLLWSPAGTEMLAQYKSARRRMLKPSGGVEELPSTAGERVLEPAELEQLVAVAQKITAELEPASDASGRPRPWDIEFGFVDGHLWLFQVRPFLGNDEVSNLPALLALDEGSRAAGRMRLDAELQPVTP
jgi:hypothetical protein